jgi:hypothetical protein
MKMGVPPTPLKARTGEETPPGITFPARAKAAIELAIERSVLGMNDFERGAAHHKSRARFGQPSEIRRRTAQARKKTAVRGRASQTAVGGESENREAMLLLSLYLRHRHKSTEKFRINCQA